MLPLERPELCVFEAQALCSGAQELQLSPACAAPSPRGQLALQMFFSSPRAGNLILQKHLHSS